MAKEFDHGGVCGGNWWNSSRNLFSSSPCSSAINEIGSLGWLSSHETDMNMKTTWSSDNSAGSVSDGSSTYTILQDVQKFKQHHDTDDNWNQDLHHDSGRSEENYSQIVRTSEALNSSINHRHKTRGLDCHDWELKNFCEDFSANPFKEDDQINSSLLDCAESCRGLPFNFPLNSASCGYSSSMLHTLFDTEQPQQSWLGNHEMNYASAANSTTDSNQLLMSTAKQQPANRLQFSNNTSFWNATVRSEFTTSTPSPFIPSGHNNLSNISNRKLRKEESPGLASIAKKSSSNIEPALKHPRIETPSPLPTFKVRKEKLGDRITALQQLVSPFGKTDTASVLHEAIGYIKFLHDQVNVLSTPYLKDGSPPLQCQQDQEGPNKNLSSRGLCLVPISSTFPVAADNTSDFWAPTFGRSFR